MNTRTTATLAAATLFLLPTAVPVLFLALLAGGTMRPASACTSAGVGVTLAGQHLDSDQMEVATQIVAAVRAFPPTRKTPRAAVIALATARQESGLRNLDYGDRDSLGAFQQRPSRGWGTPAQVMNVAHATTTFLQHLVRIQGWETMRSTDAAADVQHPAARYRNRYERWVPIAEDLTRRLWSISRAIPASTRTPFSCVGIGDASTGAVGYPVPANLAETNEDNWGGHGGHWQSWHTGTDFAVPCGTPVLAATTGTVEIDTGQSWAGRWLVKIITGPHSLATWYAHMRAVMVRAGHLVTAGQQIGQVGDLGNATGCHLHFEVHLHNGTIYGPDNTDPTPWLAAHASPNGVQSSTHAALVSREP